MIGLALAAAAGLGACGDDDAAGSTSDTDPTTTTADAEAEVTAAYQASQDAFGAAGDPPNPDHPDLAATRTGDALQKARNTLSQWAAEGAVLQGSVELDPQEVSVDGDEAVLLDCFTDNSTLVNTATGQTVQAGDGTAQRVTASLQVEDDTWKLSRFVLEGDPCE